MRNKYIRAFAAVRIVSKDVSVYERSIGSIILFIDKSGSMGSTMDDGIPKISAAAALGYTLYRKYKARVFVFDTRVREINPRNTADILLRLSSSGGTDTSRVLEEIAKIGRLYEEKTGVKPVLVIIGGFIDHDAYEAAGRLGVEIKPALKNAGSLV